MRYCKLEIRFFWNWICKDKSAPIEVTKHLATAVFVVPLASGYLDCADSKASHIASMSVRLLLYQVCPCHISCKRAENIVSSDCSFKMPNIWDFSLFSNNNMKSWTENFRSQRVELCVLRVRCTTLGVCSTNLGVCLFKQSKISLVMSFILTMQYLLTFCFLSALLSPLIVLV